MAEEASNATGNVNETNPTFGGTDRDPFHFTRCWYLVLVIESDRLLDGGARFSLNGIAEVTIGRGGRRNVDRDGNHLAIQVAGDATSKRHARFWRDGESWFLEDQSSTHGTFVNGQRLAGPARLHPGDLVQVGHAFLTLRLAILTEDGETAGQGSSRP